MKPPELFIEIHGPCGEIGMSELGLFCTSLQEAVNSFDSDPSCKIMVQVPLKYGSVLLDCTIENECQDKFWDTENSEEKNVRIKKIIEFFYDLIAEEDFFPECSKKLLSILARMGGIFKYGVSKIFFRLKSGISAEFNSKSFEKIERQLECPDPEPFQIYGRLTMIDISPKRGKRLKCRIESLSGHSIQCRFGKELECILSNSLGKLIRVSGRGSVLAGEIRNYQIEKVTRLSDLLTDKGSVTDDILAIELFKIGELSIGQASKLCNESKFEFIDRLREKGINFMDSSPMEEFENV